MSALIVTPERVRMAARACPEAKSVLETMFPEAFTWSKVDALAEEVERMKPGTWFRVKSTGDIHVVKQAASRNTVTPVVLTIHFDDNSVPYQGSWTLGYGDYTTIPRFF